MSYYSDNQKESLFAIGTRIRELREKKEVTQDDLAEFMKTGRSTIAKWENGAQDFKSEAINRLARYFDCSTDYLLRGASAENHEIYSTTGLTDKSVAQLNNQKDMEDLLFSPEPGPMSLLNEVLSDGEFYSLLLEFYNLRIAWRKLQIKIAEQELVKMKTEQRNKGYLEVENKLIQLKDNQDFLLWKFAHKLDAFAHKLLEGR